ncbi:11142_t:CDS:2 [Funneliformis caledonium]|uniref:Store-operated calcium entry-associated regulatory factor n=1 Tax=Funneliformis caledonium TaxID=1117310 RepID=A0A9N9ANG1_9GLOM|nr:11142_t:CDS:2 [Funneliformis caledonium]
MKLQIIPIFSSIILFCVHVEVDSWGDRVLLENVRALTLHKGKYTTGRRTKPIKQITCVGGDAGCSYEPDVIQCRNVGSDGSNPNWKCEATLPKSLKFGRLKVTCEGYDYPGDLYVLKGSCGLEYTLYFTNIRNEKHWFNEYFDSNYNITDLNNSSTSFSAFFGIIWLGMLGYILYNMYLTCMRTRRADNRPINIPNPPENRADNERINLPNPRFWSGIIGGGLLGYLFEPPSYGASSSYFTHDNDNNCHRYRDYSSHTTSNYNDDDKHTTYGFADTDVR